MFRIITWLFEIGVLAMVATIALGWAFGRGRSIAGIVRAMAMIVIAGVISSMIGMGFSLAGVIGGAADPVSDGLVAMILSLPLTVWTLDRTGRHRGREARPAAAGRVIDAAIEAAPDDPVVAAWHRAALLAPAQRSRIAPARDACGYVLDYAAAHPLDVEAMECAVLIRKRLPELVEQTEHFCALADRSERREAIDGLIGDIERLGRMALRRVEQSKTRLGDTLAATRAHIASRTGESATF